jgi:predicted CXXCH cytochrome family protein
MIIVRKRKLSIGGNLSFFLVMIVCMVALMPLTFAQKKDNCTECHIDLGGEAIENMDKDIHILNGLSCADCHGGDPSIETDDYEKAMDPRKGFIGAPSQQKIPEFCGKCHSDAAYMRKFNPNLPIDQLAQYKTSQHGNLLKRGDKKVATCVSCHGAHGIVAANNPISTVYPLNIVETCGKCHSNKVYMLDYEIPTDQLEQYKRSVHGKALYEEGDISAPTCNDCHGNHGPMPPEAEAIGNVCGQCHLTSWEMFNKSPHKEAYLAMDLPACETCHGNHEIIEPSDEMIGVSENSMCVTCHEKESKGYIAAMEMRGSIDSLKEKIGEAEDLVNRASSSGMEVSEESFDLREAEDQLTKARAVIHTFSIEEVQKEVEVGLEAAQKGVEGGEKALAELQFRRKGLGVSLFFIAIVAILLYLKIRRKKTEA